MNMAVGLSSDKLYREQLFIDGTWCPAASGLAYEKRNPCTAQVMGTYANGDLVDVRRAIAAARRSFDEGSWRWMSARSRGAILRRAAKGLDQISQDLAARFEREHGQPNMRPLVQDSIGWIERFAILAEDLDEGSSTGFASDAVGIVAKEPLGVVGVLTAWNHPLSVVNKGVAALAVGCSVVVKPAHWAPAGVLAIAQALSDAGLPAGAFNVITSDIDNGGLVGTELCESPDVDMVYFTGSTETGKRVMASAAGTVKNLTMELGGKSANIVFADTPDVDFAVEEAFRGFTFLTGQACGAGSRLLVERSLMPGIVDGLLERISQVQLGSPADERTTMGPLMSALHRDRVMGFIDAGKQDATLLCGGGMPPEAALQSGYFVEPTVFVDVPTSCRIAQEEIFGPVLSVIPFNGVDEAIRIANDTVYGLAAAVWTRDINKALYAAKRLRSGSVYVNQYRSTLDMLPFGGYKQSGFGRERGRRGLEEFLQEKSIHIRIDAGANA